MFTFTLLSFRRIPKKMSIFVKNVDWSQNQAKVFLNVSIPGKKSMDNVVLDDQFLKINVYPYFYELFFERPICVEQSSCTILESNIKFYLKKETDEWWSGLGKTAILDANLNDGGGNDTIPSERKREIYGEYEKRAQEDQKLRNKERSNLKRNEIEKEIERETRIRKQIDETESALGSHQLSEV